MRQLKSGLAALAVVVAGAVTCVPLASAQRGSSAVRWEVTPFAGYYIASDIWNSYPSGNSNQGSVELTNSFMWGGKLTGFMPRGGLEFSYTRAGSDAKLKQPQPGQPRAGIGRLNHDTYDINFIGFEPTGNPRVQPFGEIGFGFTVTHPEIDSDFQIPSGNKAESNTLFNFNFGLGTRVEMNEKIAMRFEGRWRITDTNISTSSGLWCDPFGYCYSYSSQWYNSGELIGGISYSFKGLLAKSTAADPSRGPRRPALFPERRHMNIANRYAITDRVTVATASGTDSPRPAPTNRFA
jgi:opacity protein-like surface antigen